MSASSTVSASAPASASTSSSRLHATLRTLAVTAGACAYAFAFATLGVPSAVNAAEGAPLPLVAPKPGTVVDFERDIYPIFKANCIACHNKTTTKADLNMETPDLMKQGGESGAGIVPGQAEKSPVFQAANHTWDSVMPPKGNKVGAANLTPEELGLVKLWIDSGAKGDLKKHQSIVWQPLPPGLNPIYATALTADGRFAACSRANQIWLYDLATQSLVSRLTDEALSKKGTAPGIAHQDLIQSLAFSPDGLTLASGSYQEVKLWRRKPASLTVQKATAALPVEPDAAARAETAHKLATELKIAPTQPLTLSADGKLLATATTAGVVQIWDTGTKKIRHDIRRDIALDKQKETLKWTIDRQQLEAAYQTAYIAQIEADNKALDERKKKAEEAIVTFKKALEEKKKALPATEAARTAAEQESKTVADLIAKLPEDTKPDAALEKRRQAAKEKLEKATKDAELAQGAVTTAENQGNDAVAEIKQIAEAKEKNAKLIAEAKATQEASNKAVAGAKAEAVKPTPFDAAKDTITAVAFSKDSTRLAALTVTGTLKIWSTATAQPLYQLTVPEDQAKVAAAAATTATPAPASSPAPATVAAATTPATSTAPAPTLVAEGQSGFLWTLPNGAQARHRESASWALEKTLGGYDLADSPLVDRVNALTFSPDAKLLAAGSGEPSRSGDITIWDPATGKLLKDWKEKHQDSVLTLDFSPDIKWLASGSADKSVRVFSLTDGKQAHYFEGHTHHVLGVSYRADGRVLASAGADNLVKTWDIVTGERKKNVEGWDKEVTSIHFLGATDTFLTSAGDNKVRILRDSGPEVRIFKSLPEFMHTATSNHLGTLIIAGGEDSILRAWELEKGTELTQFAPQ